MLDKDMIEMKLDMYQLKLSVKVAHWNDFIRLLNVENCEYRAVVSMNWRDDGWELLSYQHIH